MKKHIPSLVLIFYFLLRPGFWQCQDGSLDITFSADGKVTTDIGLYDIGNAITIQADGKILVAGSTQKYEEPGDFALVRYNSDGTMDNSFGSGGVVITDFGSNDVAFSMVLQGDGKIILAGFTSGQGYAFAAARYNSDGSLDSTFSSDGKATTNIGKFSDIAFAVALQSDGKIVLAGNTEGDLSYDFALVRYNSDGGLDSTFGNSGIVTTDFGHSQNDTGWSLAIQNDGKIVVAGQSEDENGVDLDFAIARYNSNGTMDNSFSSDGMVKTHFSSERDEAFAVTIQGDGKIIAAGRAYNNNPQWIIALARYNSDGTLDNTFGANGKVTTSITGNDAAKGIAVQTDGKIIVGGYSDNDFALARYNINGGLDSTFGSDGKVTTDFGSGDEGYALALQGDGKILVAGRSHQNIAVARYNVSSILGIARQERSGLIVSPNPCNDILTIEGANGILLEYVIIYNMGGQNLLQDDERSRLSKSINLGSLSPGIYFLECATSSGLKKVKIVKN